MYFVIGVETNVSQRSVFVQPVQLSTTFIGCIMKIMLAGWFEEIFCSSKLFIVAACRSLNDRTNTTRLSRYSRQPDILFVLNPLPRILGTTLNAVNFSRIFVL